MYLWVHWLLVLKIPILALWVLQWFTITTKKKYKLLKDETRRSLWSGSSLPHQTFHTLSSLQFPEHVILSKPTLVSLQCTPFFAQLCSPSPPAWANSLKVVTFIWKPFLNTPVYASWIGTSSSPKFYYCWAYHTVLKDCLYICHLHWLKLLRKVSYSCLKKTKILSWICEYKTKITETNMYWMFSNFQALF